MTRVAVVGAGLIGRERLDALRMLAKRGRDVAVSGVFDANAEQCRKSAEDFQTKPFATLEAMLGDDPDWVVVALPHDIAVPIAHTILRSPASLLLEKPMGRDLKESRELFETGGERLKAGFNYRYYAGIRKALQDFRAGRFGQTISIECQLGHGCAPGQEKTWKLNNQRAGGGCLIDPGVHLLDLCLLLAPDGLEVRGGTCWSGFWNTGIEEEVNIILAAAGFSITLHISIVQWRSAFRFAINGSDGYGVVTGRNRSYGPQTYTVGPRWGWQQARSQADSEKVEVQSDGMDVFADEMDALFFPECRDCPNSWPGPATCTEALQVMQLLDQIRSYLGLQREY